MKRIYINTDINDSFYNLNGFYNQVGGGLIGPMTPINDKDQLGGGSGPAPNNNCSSPSLGEVCCNSSWTNPNGNPVCPNNSPSSLGNNTTPIALGSDPCPYVYNHSNYQCGVLPDPTAPPPPSPGGNVGTATPLNDKDQLAGPSGPSGPSGPIGPALIYGCTDPAANNYNPTATADDGSCTYTPPPPLPVFGCNNPGATNYNPSATVDDGSCQYNDCPCVYPVNSNIPLGGSTGTGTGIGTYTPTKNQGMNGMTYYNFNQQGFGGYNDQLWFD